MWNKYTHNPSQLQVQLEGPAADGTTYATVRLDGDVVAEGTVRDDGSIDVYSVESPVADDTGRITAHGRNLLKAAEELAAREQLKMFPEHRYDPWRSWGLTEEQKRIRKPWL